MSETKGEKLWQPDLWTGEGVDELDLEQQKLWQREMFDQMFPLVDVKRLDRRKTQLDTLRGEPKVTWGKGGRKRPADRQRRFMPPVKCRAYVEHHPRTPVLLRYGFDRPRDVIFTFLDFVLKEQGVDIGTGDVVTFEGEDFELTSTRRPTEAYWINTEFKFYVVCPGQRYRTEGNRRVDYGGR
jgi:hypothetical protein